MYRYARLRLPSREEAEDAVQTAMLAALDARDRFDGRSTERTWLIGILRHKTLDRLRRLARERRITSTDADDPETYLSTGSRSTRPTSWASEQAAEVATSTPALRAALDTLPERERVAVVLREVDEIPIKAVCDVLSVTPTHLSTLVHRAKLRLRKALTEDDQDERV